MQKSYTSADIETALAEIKSTKGSVRSVAKKYNIPYTTLLDHVKGKYEHVGAGRPTTLTYDEEKEIVYCCQVLQEMGFGMTKDMVCAIVMDYLQSNNRKHSFNDTPGWDWWKGFRKRWPKLVERQPQHLPKQRAACGNRKAVQKWFEMVKERLEKLNIADSSDLGKRLWNCDETGICTATQSKKILSRKGSRWIHETGGGAGRENITVHGCCSANGERLPPYIVYKGKNLYSSWTENGPAGAAYSTSESGWMEKENFLSWFEKCFLPAVQSLLLTGHVVLFVDGHHSHLSISLVKLARENNVELICLPPHMTHILQPLDVGVYGPFKQEWKKILKEYKTSTRAANISKQVFPSLIKKLWDRVIKPQHCISGFRHSGIYPFNMSAIPSFKFAPSLPFTSGSNATTNSDSTETPLRGELREFFAKTLQPQETNKQQKRRRIKGHYGEALTSDEVFERMIEEDRQKDAEEVAKREKRQNRKRKQKQPTKSKKRKSLPEIEDEDHCQLCREEYNESEEEDWMGCSGCWRWYHYYCLQLDEIPDTDWFCTQCTSTII